MTAKRFKHSEIIQDDGQTICYGIEDTQTRHIFNVIGDGIYDVSEKELVKLLNELHEENKTFREALQELKEIGDYQAMTINELHEENQSLKFQLDECQNHKLYSRRELEKENEQLKKQLQSEHQMLQNAILLERTRMGKNSLKQYKEAIQ